MMPAITDRLGVTYQETFSPGVVLRRINGVLYTCYDVGCDDWGRARANRERGMTEEQKDYYRALRTAVGLTELGARLPKWVPMGKWPELTDDEEVKEWFREINLRG